MTTKRDVRVVTNSVRCETDDDEVRCDGPSGGDSGNKRTHIGGILLGRDKSPSVLRDVSDV